MKPDQRRHDLFTSADYVGHIVKGLRGHGVGEDYVQRVINIALETNRGTKDAPFEQAIKIDSLRQSTFSHMASKFIFIAFTGPDIDQQDAICQIEDGYECWNLKKYNLDSFIAAIQARIPPVNDAVRPPALFCLAIKSDPGWPITRRNRPFARSTRRRIT